MNTIIGFDGNVYFPTTGMPAFIAGKSAAIDRFEIGSDGRLGDIAVTLSGLRGELIPGVSLLELRDGWVALEKRGDTGLIISAGGKVLVSSAAPEGIAGTYLNIQQFTIDADLCATNKCVVTKLAANTLLEKPVVFGNTFKKVSINIDWDIDKENSSLTLGGAVVFPQSFPECLRGQEALIEKFRIRLSDGAISFRASYASQAGVVYDAFNCVQLSGIAIAVELKGVSLGFDLQGTVILPANKFPQGIGGTRTNARMSFDTTSGLKSVAATITLPNDKLCGIFAMQNGSVTFIKEEGKPLTLSVGGKLTLPDTFPQGLKGLTLAINTLSINTNGVFEQVDIGVNNINTSILSANVAQLRNGSINFRKGGNNDFIVNIAGAVKLTATGVPQELRSADFVIKNFEVSSKGNINAFDVEAQNFPASFESMAGVKFTVSSLNLSDSSFTMSASVKLPSSFPKGLANTEFTLVRFEMGWNGSIKDIQGGLNTCSFELAGFRASIRQLFFEKTPQGRFRISLGECRMQLPDNLGSMGGRELAIKNAWFEPDTGKFMGDVEVSSFEIDICGFILKLDSPSLDFSKNGISFRSVRLTLPSCIGGAGLTLNGVKLSAADGIQLSGGGFKLPAFKAGNLDFSNVGLNFIIEGKQYAIRGGGAVTIPNAGAVSALVSFVNVSSTYPIGLQQAEFSYQVGMQGIPLGNTGLYLTGIRGGFTYGPPNDVPAEVKYLFGSSGPRVQLGLFIADATRKLLDMDATVWIDVKDFAFATQGNAAVLRGVLDISTSITAGLSKRGLHAGLAVQIAFVRGKIEIDIFDKNGSSICSGSGYVEFCLYSGAIVNTTVLFVRVRIPWDDMWLGRINAEFGRFTNGKNGFKGWVNLPVLGNIGVFVAPGTFKIGSVSDFTIEKPVWAGNSSTRFNLTNPGVRSDDTLDRSPVMEVPYSIFIKDNNLERIVFLLAYAEGSPDIDAIAPNGTQYGPGSPDVEMVYVENAIAMIVNSPSAGNWTVRVSNAEEGTYEFTALGKADAPYLELDTGSASGQDVTTSFTVRGQTDQGNRAITLGARTAPDKPGIELGEYIPEDNGSFTFNISTDDIPDGQYLIYAQFVTQGDEVSPVIYAPGPIVVDRSTLPVPLPVRLRVAETKTGEVSLHWENSGGMRVAGYKLRIQKDGASLDPDRIISVGNITQLVIPGYDTNEDMKFSVCAYDDQSRESPYTEPVRLITGAVKAQINRPVMAARRITLTGEIGGVLEGQVSVSIEAFKNTIDATGYIFAEQMEDVNGIVLFFDGPVHVSKNTVDIGFKAGIPETLKSGIYEIPCVVKNEANGLLSTAFIIEVTLKYPTPSITAIHPTELYQGGVINVYGSGFIPGTRVYCDDEEVPLAQNGAGSSSTTLEVYIPARTRSGTYNLTVVGMNGERASHPFEIMAPDWNVVLYNRTVETCAGERATYNIGIEGQNGFSGVASFSVVEQPSAFQISLPVIAANSVGHIDINVDAGTPSGTYKSVISGGEGKRFELITVVGAEKPRPTLSSASPSSLYGGNTLTLFGYSLEQGGTAFLNERPLFVQTWSDSAITCVIPEDAASGKVYVTTSRGKSNEIGVTVRNRGFTLRGETSRITLSAGEETRVAIAVAGYADQVSLSATTESDAPLQISVDKSEVTPNALVYLTLRATASAGNGTWPVTLRGMSRNFETSAGFTVNIGDSFAIEDLTLADALLEVAYNAQLSAQNNNGTIVFRLASGTLPQGIVLGLHGELSGRARYVGLYRFTIEATDQAGHSDTREFALIVREDLWSHDAKDGGGSRYAAMDVPAEAERSWTYRGKSGVASLLVSNNQLVMVRPNGISVVSAKNGALSWEKSGAYRGVISMNDAVYALSSATLIAWNIADGTVAWERNGIESYSAGGAFMLVKSGAEFLILRTADGGLVDRRNTGYLNAANVIWNGAYAYETRESALVPLNGGPRWDGTAPILTAAVDANGFTLIDAQALITLDKNGALLNRLAAPFSATAVLALSEDAVLVLDNGVLTEYRRSDLAPRWSKTLPYTQDGHIALAKEKAVYAGPDGLIVFNRYTGARIWNDVALYTAFALYGEKIFAVDQSGTVVAFAGSANIEGPQTVITLTPAKPDGANGWYVTEPTAHIISEDRETVTAELKTRLDDANWLDAQEEILLSNGEHTLYAYGVDTCGLRGAETDVSVKVDTEKPESSIEVSAQETRDGWYQSAVTLSLQAKDTISGVEAIWTSQGRYTTPIVFANEGEHIFTWYAFDRAGNREAPHSRNIRIDLGAPYIEAHSFYNEGILTVRLDAEDSGSGVQRIEYSINDGAIEIYATPFTLTGSENDGDSMRRIRYRAMDKAGNYSEWRYCDLWVPRIREDSPLSFADINGQARQIASNARNGASLLQLAYEETSVASSLKAPQAATSKAQIAQAASAAQTKSAVQAAADATLRNLPVYASSGVYILWTKDDLTLGEHAVINFGVKKNTVVYIFLPRGAKSPGGWTMLSSYLRLNNTYYPNGVQVYMRRYIEAATVTFTDMPAGSAPPLVVAHECASIEAELTIREYVPPNARANSERTNGATIAPPEPLTEVSPGMELSLETAVRPLNHARRLPLKTRYLIFTDEGWKQLDSDHYTVREEDADTDGLPRDLRFRAEVYAPDGWIAYRTEKLVSVRKQGN